MKTIFICIIACAFISCNAQQSFGTSHLKFERSIELPGVEGRIDHMAVNLKTNLLYMAALGNNTVEVIDLGKDSVVKSISGIEEPQGIAYLSNQNEIAVASGGNGDCLFYNAADYMLVATVHLKDDADNVRYDSATNKIYVGYGNGAIAVIDALTHKLVGNVTLPAHPESFQLDKKNHLLLVNLPHANSIAVINLDNLQVIQTWKTNELNDNFPMALDTTNNQVLIGYRKPAVLVVYNVITGKEITRMNIVDDTDDVFYNELTNEAIVSGGGGVVNIFNSTNGKGFNQVANIPTRQGARTALLIPSLKLYTVAERANNGKEAALAVYTIQDKN